MLNIFDPPSPVVIFYDVSVLQPGDCFSCDELFFSIFFYVVLHSLDALSPVVIFYHESVLQLVVNAFLDHGVYDSASPDHTSVSFLHKKKKLKLLGHALWSKRLFLESTIRIALFTQTCRFFPRRSPLKEKPEVTYRDTIHVPWSMAFLRVLVPPNQP